LISQGGDALIAYTVCNDYILAKFSSEWVDGKYKCAGSSQIGALEESAIEGMIEIAKSIAHDYEHGFGGTKGEKA